MTCNLPGLLLHQYAMCRCPYAILSSHSSILKHLCRSLLEELSSRCLLMLTALQEGAEG